MKMKQKVFLICLVGLIGLSSCMAKEPKMSKADGGEAADVDSVVYKNLGKSLYELLSSPQRVSCYFLKAKENIKAEDIVIEKPFVRDTLLVGKISKEDIAILQYLLPMDRENYQNDSVIVKSPYLPVIEFLFTKKKAEAHVLVSLSDFTWTVVYDDKIQLHCNYADKKQIRRFCNKFLKR